MRVLCIAVNGWDLGWENHLFPFGPRSTPSSSARGACVMHCCEWLGLENHLFPLGPRSTPSSSACGACIEAVLGGAVGQVEGPDLDFRLPSALPRISVQ